VFDNESTLDCQDCGAILKRLTNAEAQQVADNPYNFIAFCRSCQQNYPSYM
jgi:uncharacterized protein with PIN domain